MSPSKMKIYIPKESNCDIRLLQNGKSGRLLAPFTIQVDDKDETAPKDFQTDFASTPTGWIGFAMGLLVIASHYVDNLYASILLAVLVWYMFQFAFNMGLYAFAAVMHDWKYKKAEEYLNSNYPKYLMLKKIADAMFYNIMIFLGVRCDIAFIRYLAVKFFGFKKKVKDVK